MDEKETVKIKGEDITKLDTIYGNYASGHIQGKYKGKLIKIPVATLEILLKDYDFELEKKKVHSYLINPTRRKFDGWGLGK